MTSPLLRAVRWLRVHPARLLLAPRVEVTRADADTVDLAVAGLVCGVCASRTQAALRALPGVEEACVDLDAGSARLRLAPGASLEAGALDRALARAVIAMPARRAIERAVRVWRGRGAVTTVAGGRRSR